MRILIIMVLGLALSLAIMTEGLDACGRFRCSQYRTCYRDRCTRHDTPHCPRDIPNPNEGGSGDPIQGLQAPNP